MTYKFQVTVDGDAADDLVVKVLKDAYDYEMCSMVTPDHEVMEALEVVLSYFMTVDEFDEWKAGLKTDGED